MQKKGIIRIKISIRFDGKYAIIINGQPERIVSLKGLLEIIKAKLEEDEEAKDI